MCFFRFTPGAVLQTDKKRTGPSPADVEAIKASKDHFVYVFAFISVVLVKMLS